MSMLKKLILIFAVGVLASQATASHAQQLIESYVALLSEADHFNSSGQRLTSAAAIIRQDRANYHRFGIRDPEDEEDTLFADEQNRQALERMLERGHADPGVLSRIVNGTVLVRVNVYRSASWPFVQVTVLDPRSESSIQKLSTTAEIPNRFRGEWIDTGDDPMKMRVSADGILFGSLQPVCKFTDIKVANEDGSAYEVNWHCPGSVAGVEIKMVFRLMKVLGKEVLVLVNAEDPINVSVYERAR